MFSSSRTVESETISGFDFPLPEEMPFSLHPAQVDWWKTHYRQAVIALRTREAELAASRLLHQKALQREEQLQQKIEELKAKLRQREKELFARRSEASPSKNESLKEASSLQRPRGQQKGNPGPKRRDHSHLPQKEEFVELAEDQKCCATCGLAFDEFASTEDSEEIGVEVKTHVRKIRRKRYRKTCHCPSTPTIITAPPPRKLLPKAKLGISVWVEVILSKYCSHQPTYRFIRQWEAQGLFLSQATLTDGLKRLLPLLLPLYEVMVKKQLNDTHWHADETRWMVFESLEGKSSYRWYLWVVHSSQATSILILGSVIILKPVLRQKGTSLTIMKAFCHGISPQNKKKNGLSNRSTMTPHKKPRGLDCSKLFFSPAFVINMSIVAPSEHFYL